MTEAIAYSGLDIKYCEWNRGVPVVRTGGKANNPYKGGKYFYEVRENVKIKGSGGKTRKEKVQRPVDPYYYVAFYHGLHTLPYNCSLVVKVLVYTKDEKGEFTHKEIERFKVILYNNDKKATEVVKIRMPYGLFATDSLVPEKMA